MKAARILSLFIAILMMMASVSVAEDADPVVVKAGDVEIHLSEAQDFFDYFFAQYDQLFTENGLQFSKQDAEYLLEMVIESLGQQAVLNGKVEELGLDEITDADKEDLRAEIEEMFSTEVAAYAAMVNLPEEDVVAMYAAEGITVDLIYEQSLAQLPTNRLRDYVVKDVEVTDEAIEAEYQSYVDQDKATYENDVAAYERNTAYYGSGDIHFVPSGYRYAKHILLAMPEDVSAEMIDYEADMSTTESLIATLGDELAALENPAEGSAEGEEAPAPVRTADEIQADIDEQEAKLAELKSKYEELREQILPSLKPITDEIYKKLDDGATFDELVAEYNTDPGMESNPDGYKVHKDSIVWDTAFRDAAMALEKVGDVSEPILTDFGVHIIQYAGDVEGGPVPMGEEEIASVKEQLLTAKQDEFYQETVDGWMQEAEIETHPELIVVPELPDNVVDDTADPNATAAPVEEQDLDVEVTEEDAEANEDGSVG